MTLTGGKFSNLERCVMMWDEAEFTAEWIRAMEEMFKQFLRDHPPVETAHGAIMFRGNKPEAAAKRN
jgi:hypothetical protein